MFYPKLTLLFSMLTLGLWASCSGGNSANSTAAAAPASFPELQSLHVEMQKVWEDLFPRFYDYPYDALQLQIVTGVDSIKCAEQTFQGFYYCPATQTIYMQAGLLEDMEDLQRIYHYCHLLGHHITYLNGTMDFVERKLSAAEGQDEELLLRWELHIEYLAGLGLHHSKSPLKAGLLDDKWQKALRPVVRAEQHTHNYDYTAVERRLKWFRRGMQAGDLSQGDTFAPALKSL